MFDQIIRATQGKTFAVTTVGCKVNQADSEAIGEQMSAAGFIQRDFSEDADVYIVNTCTVTHLGDRSSRNLIAQAHRHHPDALLVVTGCYAQLNPKAVAALPGVDVVVGNTEKDALVAAIAQRENTDTCRSSPIEVQDKHLLPMFSVGQLDTQHIGSDTALSLQESEPLPDNPARLAPCISEADTSGTSTLASTRLASRTRVQMKVQDGCDNRCTYCIVPTVRGSSRSRSIASVVEHVKRKVRAGYQEIVLTGIHLGDYHPHGDEQRDLGDLIATLLKETDIPRIRVSSLEPEDFRLEWLALWQDRRMCRHLHLPMQSGSDTILRRMARRYNSTRYTMIVTEAKRLVPGMAISTDIITGFPGESDEDFEQTYQLAQKLEFAKSHVFRYSPRQGTAAARMKGQIQDPIKKARSERLLALNDQHSQQFRQQFLGETVEVLVEHPRHDTWEGLTDNYLRVELHNPPTYIHQHALVKAHLTHLVDDGVCGMYIG
ncbi:MAG: tRNA (N(6)-L-threonylcarbamoyladenosine(37)-C(2))-methylthiotransferase MtaB [Ktedonobacteraceae bacterium]